MKKGLVIADSRPVFSLACLDKLDLLNEIFEGLYMTPRVWNEITADTTRHGYSQIYSLFKDSVRTISDSSKLALTTEEEEMESLILYKELQAIFLLIEDEKKRAIPKHSNVNYIGVIGVLSAAKDFGLIKNLKPLFETLLQNNLFFSIRALNGILVMQEEEKIDIRAYPGHEEDTIRGKNVLF
jgi:uncharacterized protein